MHLLLMLFYRLERGFFCFDVWSFLGNGSSTDFDLDCSLMVMKVFASLTFSRRNHLVWFV